MPTPYHEAEGHITRDASASFAGTLRSPRPQACRVTYPRDVLQVGVDIVAQRTATAENGEKVTSETRCRIRDEDAAKWQ